LECRTSSIGWAYVAVSTRFFSHWISWFGSPRDAEKTTLAGSPPVTCMPTPKKPYLL